MNTYKIHTEFWRKRYQKSTATYVQNAKTVPEKLQVEQSKDQVTKSL